VAALGSHTPVPGCGMGMWVYEEGDLLSLLSTLAYLAGLLSSSSG